MNIHWIKDLKHPQQKNSNNLFHSIDFQYKNLSIFINVIKIPSKESYFSEERKKSKSIKRSKKMRKEEKNINKVKRHFW